MRTEESGQARKGSPNNMGNGSAQSLHAHVVEERVEAIRLYLGVRIWVTVLLVLSISRHQANGFVTREPRYPSLLHTERPGPIAGGHSAIEIRESAERDGEPIVTVGPSKARCVSVRYHRYRDLWDRRPRDEPGTEPKASLGERDPGRQRPWDPSIGRCCWQTTSGTELTVCSKPPGARRLF